MPDIVCSIVSVVCACVCVCVCVCRYLRIHILVYNEKRSCM